MKSIALVLALAPVAALPVRAQVQAAAPKAPEETCPCSSYRFVAKTEKAKAVAAYWAKRRAARATDTIGAIALIFSAGQPTNAVRESLNASSDATDAMLAARARAAELGGLRVEGAGADARATITLKLGEDYELKAP